MGIAWELMELGYDPLEDIKAQAKTESIITEHGNICVFCGKPAECEHHLVFGSGKRNLAEQGGLGERIHDNPIAEKLSKMLGQAIYEARLGSREDFRTRYGKSYL